MVVDQEGERITNEDMRGSFVLYNFTYTNCPDDCKQMDQTMKTIQDQLHTVELGDIDVSLVTISFDPERDTPEVLQAYAESVNANPDIWRFTTLADPTMMKYVIGGGFETYYEPQADGSYKFDPAYILVDGWGIVRGEYRYQTMTPDSERILRHLGVLAEEVINSQGANSIAYEAAHYFLCYAP
jgi:protein SCO1/2